MNNDLLNYYKDAVANLECNAFLENLIVNDLRFYFVSAGPKDGKLILLLHGYPECWHTWKNQIPFLVEQGYRVIAPDLRGYGLNDKLDNVSDYKVPLLVEDIKQIIKAQGSESAIVIAHDWGGILAWYLTMWSPKYVEGLITLNAPHPVPFLRGQNDPSSEQYKMSSYIRYFQTSNKPERELINNPIHTARKYFINERVHLDAYSDNDIKLYAENYANPGTMTAMLNWYRAYIQYQNELPENNIIEVPTLVIWGHKERTLSTEMLDGLEKWVSNLEITHFKNASHFVHNDEPNNVNKVIETFIKNLSFHTEQS